MKLFLSLLLVSVSATAQKDNYAGTYTDMVVKLTLNADNTFTLDQPDPVFAYTHKHYESSGTWQGTGKDIVLNPHLKKRETAISFTESFDPASDSISIKVNYITETYENEKLVSRAPCRFHLFTVYINKRRNYKHLSYDVRVTQATCLFAKDIKNLYALDSTSTVRFQKTDRVEKLGLKTYGLEDFIELNPKDPKSNYFEITVVQPIDTDRAPRNKNIFVNGAVAYFYERNGKLSKLATLYRKKDVAVTESN